MLPAAAAAVVLAAPAAVVAAAAVVGAAVAGAAVVDDDFESEPHAARSSAPAMAMGAVIRAILTVVPPLAGGRAGT
jgi:hypothetical protein